MAPKPTLWGRFLSIITPKKEEINLQKKGEESDANLKALLKIDSELKLQQISISEELKKNQFNEYLIKNDDGTYALNHDYQDRLPMYRGIINDNTAEFFKLKDLVSEYNDNFAQLRDNNAKIEKANAIQNLQYSPPITEGTKSPPVKEAGPGEKKPTLLDLIRSFINPKPKETEPKRQSRSTSRSSTEKAPVNQEKPLSTEAAHKQQKLKEDQEIVNQYCKEIIQTYKDENHPLRKEVKQNEDGTYTFERDVNLDINPQFTVDLEKVQAKREKAFDAGVDIQMNHAWLEMNAQAIEHEKANPTEPKQGTSAKSEKAPKKVTKKDPEQFNPHQIIDRFNKDYPGKIETRPNGDLYVSNPKQFDKPKNKEEKEYQKRLSEVATAILCVNFERSPVFGPSSPTNTLSLPDPQSSFTTHFNSLRTSPQGELKDAPKEKSTDTKKFRH